MKCPTCGSPHKKWHPATQYEGEVKNLCRDLWHSPTAAALEAARPQDWGEDFNSPDDNGCYGHKCSTCGIEYIAHKRRYATCKLCDEILKRGNKVIRALREDGVLSLTSDDAKALLLRISVLEKSEKKAVELMLKDFARS